MDLISDEVKQFIFAHIDSALCLETLLFLHAEPSRASSVAELSAEFRCSPASLGPCLEKLKALDFAREVPGALYHYSPGDPAREAMMQNLVEAYRIQRHRVLELIFSPLKKARDFADSFRIHKKGDGDA